MSSSTAISGMPASSAFSAIAGPTARSAMAMPWTPSSQTMVSKAVIAQKAKAAGIPVVAVDDDIYYEDGPGPYVGMNASTSARRSAKSWPRSTVEEGWAGKEVRIASIEDRKADTCMQRNKGAEEAFLKAVPDFNPETSSASPTTTRWSTPST